MARQRTRLSDKDFKLLKKEGMGILGESGHLFPTFGNHVEDFVKFCIYDLNDTYIKSGISEDFENDGNTIKLKPGNDLRRAGFTRGDYKIKYFFYRRLAGADEIVLTKTVGDESGVVHSGNPQLTGIPMGLFYVDEDGKVFQGETPPVDTPPSELDVKEYKFFIDKISADKKEVRLAPQSINLNKYKDEFSSLSKLVNKYSPLVMSAGTDVYGKGKFGNSNSTGFTFDAKHPEDVGFLDKYLGGTLEIENAFVVGNVTLQSIEENSSWTLEDPIPEITIETNYPDSRATTNTPVTFMAKVSGGNVAPSQLSYYWDFGCGHQELGGPEITHTYTITGNMNVSVVINSLNFVDTVPYGPLVVTGESVEETLEVDPTLEYIPDGVLVQRWNPQNTPPNQPTGNIYLIEEGKKRKFNFETEAAAYLEATGVNTHPQVPNEDGNGFVPVSFDIRPHIRFLEQSVITAIPPGPDFTNDDLAGQATIPFYNITVEAGTGGVVTGQGNNTTGTNTFEDGSTININAEAQSGMEFVNWTNAETDSSGNQNQFSNINSSSTSVLVKANSTITANFQDSTNTTYYNITVEAGTGGTVTGGGNVEQGSVINISATPGTNYEFSHWTQSGQNSVVTNVYDATTTATANSDATVDANFTFVHPTYTLSVNSGAHGRVSIDDGTADATEIANQVQITAVQGSTHTIYAHPNTNYMVSDWDNPDWDDDDEVSIDIGNSNMSAYVSFMTGN